MSGTMTAARLVAPGRFELETFERPTPAAGQVRVAIEGSGVCASSLPVWQGRPWFRYPLPPGEPGHEGWGRVEACGAEVDARWLGRRVGIISSHAYAEAEVVDVEDLVSLPETGSPLPLEPFGCVFNAAERSEFRRGQTVAIVGLGFIGLALARLASRAGARVIGLSSRACARALALDFGAEEALASGASGADGERQAEAAREVIAQRTSGRGCELVVECTGHQAPLDLAGELVGERGRLVIAGFHQDGPRRVDLQQWNWKGIDVVNAHERSRDRIRHGMRVAARDVAADPDWARLLVTDDLPLSQLDAAHARALLRPSGFVKAAVSTARGDS